MPIHYTTPDKSLSVCNLRAPDILTGSTHWDEISCEECLAFKDLPCHHVTQRIWDMTSQADCGVSGQTMSDTDPLQSISLTWFFVTCEECLALKLPPVPVGDPAALEMWLT